MSRQELDPREALERMVAFARLGPDRGVNNFVLRGPINVPTVFTTFVGIFPPIDLVREGEYIIVSTEERSPRNPFLSYSRIIDQEVPRRVLELGIEDVPLIRSGFEACFTERGMPSVMLGFGATVETHEEAVVLWSVRGISPQTALKRIQDRTLARRARMQ